MNTKPDEQDVLAENDALKMRIRELEAQTKRQPAPTPAAPQAATSKPISAGATPPLSGNGQPPAPAVGEAPAVPSHLRNEMLWGRRAGSLEGKATVAAMILALSDAVPRKPNPYKEGSLSYRCFEKAEDARVQAELRRRQQAREVKSDVEGDQPEPDEHPPGAVLTKHQMPGFPWASPARATEQQGRLESRRDELTAMAKALHGKIVGSFGTTRTLPTPTNDVAGDIAVLERFVDESRADLVAHRQPASCGVELI